MGFAFGGTLAPANRFGRPLPALDFPMYLTQTVLAALAFASGGVLMKHADGVRHVAPLVGVLGLFCVGAALQSLAMRGESLGATYVVVLGLEAVLAFALGATFFGEAVTWSRAAAVVVVVGGIAWLRVS